MVLQGLFHFFGVFVHGAEFIEIEFFSSFVEGAFLFEEYRAPGGEFHQQGDEQAHREDERADQDDETDIENAFEAGVKFLEVDSPGFQDQGDAEDVADFGVAQDIADFGGYHFEFDAVVFAGLVDGLVAVDIHGFGNDKNHVRVMGFQQGIQLGIVADDKGLQVFVDFRVGFGGIADVAQDMEESAEDVAYALGEFVCPFVGADDQGFEADDAFFGEVVLEAAQQAVAEFPEHVDDEKRGEYDGAGVFLAFDDVEEGHGEYGDEDDQAFVGEAQVFPGEVVAGAVDAQAQAEQDKDYVHEDGGFGIVFEIPQVAEAEDDAEDQGGVQQEDIEE